MFDNSKLCKEAPSALLKVEKKKMVNVIVTIALFHIVTGTIVKVEKKMVNVIVTIALFHIVTGTIVKVEKKNG